MDLTLPAKIVDEARSWIGTPYVHQGSCKGGGTDCLGLLRGIWREVLGEEPEAVPAYTRDWSEANGEEFLWNAARRNLRSKPLTEIAAGDVLLFRMRSGAVAKHLGIQSTRTTFIHAYSGHAVLENSFSQPWRRRLVERFEFPGGESEWRQ